MKAFWLISSCFAAIDIGQIKLPSAETLDSQHDLPFFANRIRDSLEVADRSQYLKATRELLEELSDEDRFLKYQHLAHQELLDLMNVGEPRELELRKVFKKKLARCHCQPIESSLAKS